jgi:hypothetical protein
MNGLSAEEKGNIIRTCLSQLHLTGILIKSLTFDRAPSNIAMAKFLGANQGRHLRYAGYTFAYLKF